MAKGKRDHYDEEDDDLEQDRRYDEEDEEEEDNSRHKKKKPRNMFLDMEAEVDDDEEEDYDDDEEFGKEDGFIQEDYHDEPSSASSHRAARHLDLDRRNRKVEEIDAEEVAARLQTKYGRSHTRNVYRGDTEHVPQRFLVPSVEDPNLWMIKCKPGKERDIIMTMMRRCFDKELTDNPLQIISAFARDSLKGYVYVEARKQAHVQQAVDKITDLFAFKLTLVPIGEMVDVINVQKKEADLIPGGWVRLKRGNYSGDLAQILEIADTQESVRVKLIPRLDFTQEKKKSAAFRPPQKLFNPKDVEKLDRSKPVFPKPKGYFLYGNELFKDGYLEKDVKITSLVTEFVNPTLDEITRFSNGGVDDERGLDLSTLGNSGIVAQFQPGDHVEVTEGDLINLHGVVESVENDIVMIIPQDRRLLEEHLKFPARQLRKRFAQGEHVKVINGRFSGETGLIIKVEDNVVTMLSDVSMTQVTVFSKDLREAAEVASGVSGVGSHELHDFVQLDPQTVGVIIKIDRDTCRILDQNGNVRNIQPHQISSSRDSRKAVAVDSQGNNIRVGDQVKEIDGEKRQGTVLHIYRLFAFLRSREILENSGVFVARTRQLLSTSSRPGQRQSSTTLNPSVMNNFAIPTAPRGRGRERGRGGMMGRGRGRGGRDKLISQTVTVISGPYKGYLGIVKDTSDDQARVELHTNSKIISVDKTTLEIKDRSGTGISITDFYGVGGRGGHAQNGGRFDNNYRRNDRGGYSRYGDGNATPMHPSGSRTPAWQSGSRTPAYSSYSGSRTPIHRVEMGSATPNPYADGSHTPAWDAGSKTPGWNGGSSGDGWGSWGGATPRKSNEWGDDWNTSSRSTDSRYDSGKDTKDTSKSYSNSYDTYTTPSYDTIQTPAPTGVPSTPAPVVNTPGPSSYTNSTLSAPTPAPLAPVTPAPSSYPHTPFMPSGGDFSRVHDDVHDILDQDWATKDIQVRVVSNRHTGQKYQAGGYDQQSARIRYVNRGGESCEIVLDGSNDKLSLPVDYIEPVKPNKNDKIKVMGGEFKGQVGTLIGIDGQDGIVKLEGGRDFKILNINGLAKFASSGTD
ncbi:transcription elongation factor Spt5 [Basidiobolus meristosporus CBS 931.73]|uniref:Transcription elongation factor SPT5 n=1 Tax=Basidiobolus meristosporus CBS 931.73 TaxID=1314790 RepID=A0A1Y1Z4P4_9FUNG|nr:transcription elongation factor Spt5 [Basidiobolus meristosporus CBS 931.73]|eukprot:ORY05248.1 transcription elongation factor Spt5 [Basidiobolus meristosporus CBS 931.73]